MTRDQAIAQILCNVISGSAHACTADELKNLAMGATAAFSAGMALYDSGQPSHASACASTGAASTCGCKAAIASVP